MNSMRKKKYLLGSIILFSLIFSATYHDKMLALISLLQDHFYQLVSGETLLPPWLMPLLFAGVSLFALPVAPVELLSGLLFGPLWGTIYVVIGGFCAAVISFMLTRYFFSDKVAHYIKKRSGLLSKSIRLIEQKGWQAVALLRLSTVIPFSPLNYAFGLTKICHWEYVWGTALFMIPPTALYVYVGSLGKSYLLNPNQSYLLQILSVSLIAVSLTLIGWVVKKELANIKTV